MQIPKRSRPSLVQTCISITTIIPIYKPTWADRSQKIVVSVPFGNPLWPWSPSPESLQWLWRPRGTTGFHLFPFILGHLFSQEKSCSGSLQFAAASDLPCTYLDHSWSLFPAQYQHVTSAHRWKKDSEKTMRKWLSPRYDFYSVHLPNP